LKSIKYDTQNFLQIRNKSVYFNFTITYHSNRYEMLHALISLFLHVDFKYIRIKSRGNQILDLICKVDSDQQQEIISYTFLTECRSYSVGIIK